MIKFCPICKLDEKTGFHRYLCGNEIHKIDSQLTAVSLSYIDPKNLSNGEKMSTPFANLSVQVREVCKIGQKHECCRYLVGGAKGFECAKFSIHKAYLDLRVANKDMSARGDNCEGRPLGELL